MDTQSVAIGLLVLGQVAVSVASWLLHRSHEKERDQWLEERRWLETCAIVSNGGRVPVDPQVLKDLEQRRQEALRVQFSRPSPFSIAVPPDQEDGISAALNQMRQ